MQNTRPPALISFNFLALIGPTFESEYTVLTSTLLKFLQHHASFYPTYWNWKSTQVCIQTYIICIPFSECQIELFGHRKQKIVVQVISIVTLLQQPKTSHFYVPKDTQLHTAAIIIWKSKGKTWKICSGCRTYMKYAAPNIIRFCQLQFYRHCSVALFR